MIPCFIDSEGRRSVDPLWHKDLVEHLGCIRNMTLAAPARREPPGYKVVPIDHAGLAGHLSYVDLPPCRTTLGAIVSIPAASLRLWRAIGRADIVHVNAGGWPLSFGWIAAPMARLRGKFVLTNIEGAFWRDGWKWPLKLKKVIQAVIYESMARLCVNLSDLATFTQAGYRDTMLLKGRRARGHIICASWIDRDVIVSRADAEELWRSKLEDRARPLRVVFAGNMIVNKGLMVLIDALKVLEQRGLPLHVQLYGNGPLREECARIATHFHGSVRLEVCGVLAYGPEFFAMLRRHDLLVAPSLSEEQPRIVYDGFSQALPILATDTTGLKECVSHGNNGWLVPRGDAAALAGAIAWASEHREALRDCGIAALEAARGLTHDQMHSRRAALILEAMSQRGRRS